MSTETTEVSPWRELLQVEQRGIEPLDPEEQTSNPIELFWIWFAGNISILGLPLGIWVVAGQLNLWQALLAGAIGSVASFAIVGIVSIAGQRGAAPSLTLSRAVFGSLGNFVPTAVAIFSRWGWETVNAVTASYAILSIATVIGGKEIHPADMPALAFGAVVMFLALTMLVSGLGHTMLAVFQKWATIIFGILTLVVVAFIIMNVDWAAVLAAPPGPAGTVLVGIGVVASGTGLSWATSGADIGRYQSPATKPSALVTMCAAGAGIPLVIMIGTGSLIGITNPGFDADNPLASIPALLPPWMSIPFLVAAFAGLLLSNNISVYSAGFTLLTLGIKARRIVAVVIELCVSLIGSMIFLFVFGEFYGPFIGFIVLLAVPLTAWLGVFLVDMIKRYAYDGASLLAMDSSSAYWYSGGFEWRALGAWAAGIFSGFIFMAPAFSETFIAANGLNWLVTMIISAMVYYALGGARGVGTLKDPEKIR